MKNGRTQIVNKEHQTLLQNFELAKEEERLKIHNEKMKEYVLQYTKEQTERCSKHPKNLKFNCYKC